MAKIFSLVVSMYFIAGTVVAQDLRFIYTLEGSSSQCFL